MLNLFTVWTPESTGAVDENGKATERRYSMTSTDFNNGYSISAEQALGYDGENLISRTPATLLAVNNKSPFFYNTVAHINVQTLESLRNEAVQTLKGRWYVPLDWDKVKYFNHGAKYDIKSKQLKSFTYAYVDGVGLLESDYIGNLFYGSVMSNFQTLAYTLSDGDFLQHTGIDDAFDSHAIIVGYKFGSDAINKSTFQSIKNVMLEKYSTYQGKYYQTYNISVNRGQGWKDQEIHTNNY